MTYEQELLNRMAKNFIPIETTNLTERLNKFDKILCSLKCQFIYKPPSSIQQVKWESPVLLTDYGIFYKNYNGENWFTTWKKKGVKITFETSELIIQGKKIVPFNEKIKNKETGLKEPLYSKESFNIIKQNFTPFCKMLHLKYFHFLLEMFALIKKPELINDKIDNNGLNKFQNNIFLCFTTGYTKEGYQICSVVLNILKERTNEDRTNEEKKAFWDLWAYIQKKNGENLENYSNKDKFTREHVIPLYQDALDHYNKILELDPLDSDALLNKKYRKWWINNLSIPLEIRKENSKLKNKANELFEKKKYEQALEIYKECYKINNLQSDVFGERYIEVLEIFGMYDEIREFLKEFEFLDDVIKKRLSSKTSLQDIIPENF